MLLISGARSKKDNLDIWNTWLLAYTDAHGSDKLIK